MLRIAHLVPALVKGGGERAAVDLANWQVRHGHEVIMIVGRFADEALLRADLDPLIEVRYISRQAGRMGRYPAGVAWLFKERRWLSRLDVMHAHLTFSAAMVTLIFFWQRLTGSKRPALVETYHAVGMPIHRLARRVHSWMAGKRHALALMAEDRYWREFQARHPTLRVALIPNGLPSSALLPRSDPKVQSYADEARLRLNGTLVVGNIGRLVAERRPDRLAETFVRIGQLADRTISFLVAGEGPERAAIERMFAEAGLKDCAHLPGLAIDPVAPISLMDLYVSFNVGPVTGLAGLQAAQCGVPVIAIQLDNEYAPGAADWIWSHQSVERVASEALRLLEDAEARRELARCQKEYVGAYLSVETMGRAYDELYGSVLPESGAAS